MTPFRNLRTSCASALLVAAASCALGTPGCAHLRRDKVTSDEVVACRQLSREGVAALERGDCTRARELLDQAVAASPSDLEARRELAEVLWQEGSHQEAMVHMEAAVRLDPRLAPRLRELLPDGRKHFADLRLLREPTEADDRAVVADLTRDDYRLPPQLGEKGR